jgi:hypothetical protein
VLTPEKVVASLDSHRGFRYSHHRRCSLCCDILLGWAKRSEEIVLDNERHV